MVDRVITRCIIIIAITITLTGTTAIAGMAAKSPPMGTRRIVIGGLLLGACAFAQAEPTAAPSARELHAAQCVAALQVSADALAQQVKSGNEAARPVLQGRLEAGAAFVGDAYLHGTTDEGRARALANDALEAQKRLNAARLSARQAACAAEGATLLSNSNGLERSVVKRIAKKRMEKLLGG
jgi:hypothetical protein